MVTDAGGMTGLENPIIFHTRSESDLKSEAFVLDLLRDEYDYSAETVEGLDIFTFEVKESEIMDVEG